MDTKPFLEFDMLDIQQSLVNELKRFTKPSFDLDETLIAASDLKYTKEIKQTMTEQLESPAEDFVRFFLSSVYSGVKTQAVIQQFTDIVKRALNQFLSEQINELLQSAIRKGEAAEQPVDEEEFDEFNDEEVESRIVTTDEELEGFYIVKSIVREVVAPERIAHRDYINYMSVVLDDSRLKLICRLYFNSPTKRLGLIDEERKDERVEISSMDDIYKYAEQLKAAALHHDAPAASEDSERN